MDSLYDALKIRIDATEIDIQNAINHAETDGSVQSGLLSAARHILLDQGRRHEYNKRIREALETERQLRAGGLRNNSVGQYPTWEKSK